jgi:Icc protein
VTPRDIPAASQGASWPAPAAPTAPEVTTVSDDDAVVHLPARDGRPVQVRAYRDLRPGRDYRYDGVSFRTLDHPGGQLLARVATVNDVHFGERAAGIIAGTDMGPVLASEPGREPYPEVMNRAAAADISAWGVDLLVAKGDLTDAGRPEELDAFSRCYGAFEGRLVAVPGNHDVAGGPWPSGRAPFRHPLPHAVDLPGLTVAVVDTTIPERATGRLSAEARDWLDELGAGADRPVLVMGHHHAWSPDYPTRNADYYGLDPDSSEALVEIFCRRPRLVAWLAGHTHRNRVRRFSATGDRPWVEVASVKEFPGVWAEYRAYEGGILQVVRRVGGPPPAPQPWAGPDRDGQEALEWSERTRALYRGNYPAYAFGRLPDRCFPLVSPA